MRGGNSWDEGGDGIDLDKQGVEGNGGGLEGAALRRLGARACA